MKLTRLRAIRMLLPAVLAVLYACTTQRPQAVDEPARLHAMPFNVVATGDSRVDAATASTFSWATGIAPLGDSLLAGEVPVNTLLEEAIAAALQQKGYRYSAATGQGDLLLSYAVTLNDAAADRELAQKYGMQADLSVPSPDPEKYEKGTLVIDVIERHSGLTAWRSSLQGFAYLQMDAAERRQRINGMVQRMLAGLPARH